MFRKESSGAGVFAGFSAAWSVAAERQAKRRRGWVILAMGYSSMLVGRRLTAMIVCRSGGCKRGGSTYSILSQKN
jgi:hypothetical protein